MNGVWIGDKHTEKDWGLICTGFSIGAPAPKVLNVDVPGRDGALDLTESLTGQAVFENRQLQFTFVHKDTEMEDWHQKYWDIMEACHGKCCRIVMDTDPDWYYVGRITCNQKREDQMHSTLEINCDCEPFKYKVDETRVTASCDASGTEVVLTNNGRAVLPVISSTQDIRIEFCGVSFAVSASTQTRPLGMAVPAGESQMTVYSLTDTAADIIVKFREVRI